MLLTTVAMGLLLQGPQDIEMKTWVDRDFDPAQPNGYVVSGAPELTRKEAWASAERNAIESHNERLRDYAETQAAAAAKSWLPEFVRDKVVTEWTRDRLRRLQPKVLDRDLIVRDHEFGRSYQAFYLVEPLDTEHVERLGGLAPRLAREEEWFLVKTGGMVGFWALIALVITWIDRLSRGYMTKRLIAIGSLLALVGPALVVVL